MRFSRRFSRFLVNVKKNLDIPPRDMHMSVTQESSLRSRCGLGNMLQAARRGRKNEEPRPWAGAVAQ